MPLHGLPVQQAIYDQLTAALAPLPVFDEVPENRVYPYITIGETQMVTADGLTNKGVDLSPTVHTWSRQRGFTETLELMSLVFDALEGRVLPVTGFQWVTTSLEIGNTLRDLDGITRHGILRFKVLTYK